MKNKMLKEYIKSQNVRRADIAKIIGVTKGYVDRVLNEKIEDERLDEILAAVALMKSADKFSVVKNKVDELMKERRKLTLRLNDVQMELYHRAFEEYKMWNKSQMYTKLKEAIRKEEDGGAE